MNWLEAEGKRVLAKSKVNPFPPVMEVRIAEVSPSGAWVKFGSGWQEAAQWILIEVLRCP